MSADSLGLLCLGGALLGGAAGEAVRRGAADLSYRYPEERDHRRPRQAWVVPLGALLGGLLVAGQHDRPATLVLLLALLWPFLRLAVIDQDVHRLPDRLTKPLYPVVLAGLAVVAAVEGDWPSLGRAVLAGLVGLAAYLVLAVVGGGGLGLGDVKLAGVLGLLCGWFSWATAALGLSVGFVLAALWAAVLLLLRRATRKDFIALGPYLIVGALLCVAVAP